jgi:HAD superfamily hydrolase (TIGR01509 family)
MEREPLAILGRHVQPGLADFLEACRARGIRMGTLSDYPGDEKLRALGVDEYFDVRLCAQSPEIGVFKPDPRGLHVALERLGTTARETLYIGDRADVDAAAADAAGIPCAILTRARPAAERPGYISIPSYTDLAGLLFGPDVSQARRTA